MAVTEVLYAVGGGLVVALSRPLVLIPRDLDAHDLRIRVLREDGHRWIGDETHELARRLSQISTDSYAANPGGDGAHVQRRRSAVDDSADALRNEVARAEQEVRDILNVQERWWHGAWRRAFRRGKRARPVLTYRDEAVDALTEWRAAETRFAIASNAPLPGPSDWKPNELIP